MDYNKGETIVFDVEIRNASTNVLFDPSAINISIITGTRIKINEVLMNKKSTGIYTYSWTSDEVGLFKVIYKAVDGTKITTKKVVFKVINI